MENYDLISSYSHICIIAGLTKQPFMNEMHNDDVITMTVICIKKNSSNWKPWPSQGSILLCCLEEDHRNSKHLHVACAAKLSKVAKHRMANFMVKCWMRKVNTFSQCTNFSSLILSNLNTSLGKLQVNNP